MQNPNQRYNIICLSNQLWDFPNWTNKRHVMTRLAKAGHHVLFVDPPLNTGNVFFRQIKRGLWNIRRILTQTHRDTIGALIYTPLNVIPFSEITSSWHIKRINKLGNKEFDKGLKTILWIYHVQIPYLIEYISKLEYDILVYDCVDNYEGFPSSSSFYSATVPKEKVMEQEKMLSERADIVFATAPGLVDKLKNYTDKVFFTPNVGDYEKFKVVRSDSREIKVEVPVELENIKRPRVGFTGALDEYKFDLELFKKSAMAHPDYSFILIGQIALKDKSTDLSDLGLSDLPNVYFLGYKPYETLEGYYEGFDAFIIPYQLNDYTVGGCFPVKFHDALAAGLPTVVTDLPAYRPFDNICYISKTDDDFIANITKSLDEDNGERTRSRKEVAKQNSWEGKVETMLSLLSSQVLYKDQ